MAPQRHLPSPLPLPFPISPCASRRTQPIALQTLKNEGTHTQTPDPPPFALICAPVCRMFQTYE